MKDALTKAYALIGVQSVEHVKGRMSFRIQKDPVMRVFALEDKIKDSMVIVPATTKFDMKQGVCGIEICVGKDKVYASSSTSPKCFSEFWALRRSHEKKQCNCDMTNRKTTVVGARGVEVTVTIPCVKNTKAISKDDELVLYVPASVDKVQKKHDRAKVSLEDEPAQKKAKV